MYCFFGDVYGSINFHQLSGPKVIKLFSMLSLVEHELLNAHKYKNIKKFNFFLGPDMPRMLFSHSFMLKCQLLLAF